MATFLIGCHNLNQSGIMFRKLNDFQESFSDNPLHNYLEFYKDFIHVPCTASKTELDIKDNKSYIQVALRVTERIKLRA